MSFFFVFSQYPYLIQFLFLNSIRGSLICKILRAVVMPTDYKAGLYFRIGGCTGFIHFMNSTPDQYLFLVCTWRHKKSQYWNIDVSNPWLVNVLQLCFISILGNWDWKQRFVFNRVQFCDHWPSVVTLLYESRMPRKSIHVCTLKCLMPCKTLENHFLVRSVAKPFESIGAEFCTAKGYLVLAAMLLFLKRTSIWPPHTFLFKVFSCLLTHIYVVKCIHVWNVAQLCSFSTPQA